MGLHNYNHIQSQSEKVKESKESKSLLFKRTMVTSRAVIIFSLILTLFSSLSFSLPQSSKLSCKSSTCLNCLDKCSSRNQCNLCALCLGSKLGPCAQCEFCKGGVAGCKKLCKNGKNTSTCRTCITNCS